MRGVRLLQKRLSGSLAPLDQAPVTMVLLVLALLGSSRAA